MTTKRGREEPAAELWHQPQGLDEIEASISALETAMLGDPVRNRAAIHELGCRIVANALKNNK
jgi:hypothetical protein